jgi:hypothetical protein
MSHQTMAEHLASTLSYNGVTPKGRRVEMKRIVIATGIFCFALFGCQPAPSLSEFPTPSPMATPVSSPTATALPPTPTPVPLTATPTTPPTGISGMVKYTGTKLGSILVFVSTESGGTPMGEEAIKSFGDVSGGEFGWSLSAGIYYVGALLQVAGPPSSDYPFVTCGPIEVKDNMLVKIEIALTDAEIGGKPRDCGMKTP